MPPQRTQHSLLQQWGQKRGGGLDSSCAIAAPGLGSVLIGPPTVARCFPVAVSLPELQSSQNAHGVPAAPARSASPAWGKICAAPHCFLGVH